MGQEGSTVVRPDAADHPIASVETLDCNLLSKLEEQNEEDVREAGSSNSIEITYGEKDAADVGIC